VVNVFTSPTALLSDSTLLINPITNNMISKTVKTEKELCDCIQSAIVSLKADKPLEYIVCPKCDVPHLDKYEWAHKDHHTHLCNECNCEFDNVHTSIGNPLARFALSLDNAERLVIDMGQVTQLTPAKPRNHEKLLGS
jgi:hypothetical protein